MGQDGYSDTCEVVQESSKSNEHSQGENNKTNTPEKFEKQGLERGHDAQARKSFAGENVINLSPVSEPVGSIEARGEYGTKSSHEFRFNGLGSSSAVPSGFATNSNQYWQTMKYLLENGTQSELGNSNLVNFWSAWMSNRSPQADQMNLINQYWSQVTEKWNAMMKDREQDRNYSLEIQSENQAKEMKEQHRKSASYIAQQEPSETSANDNTDIHAVGIRTNSEATSSIHVPSPLTIPENKFNVSSISPQSAPVPGFLPSKMQEYRPWSAPRLTQFPSFQFPAPSTYETKPGYPNPAALQEKGKTYEAETDNNQTHADKTEEKQYESSYTLNDFKTEKPPTKPPTGTQQCSNTTAENSIATEEQNRRFMDELRRRFTFHQSILPGQFSNLPNSPIPPFSDLHQSPSNKSPVFYPSPALPPQYYLRFPSTPSSPLTDARSSSISSDSPGLQQSPKLPNSRRSRTRGPPIDSVHAAIVREAKEQFKGLDPENMYIQCPICQKRIKRLYHFQRHMRIHTGEKTHQCPCCQYKSVRKDNLKSHMKTHEKQTIENGRRTKSGFQNVRESESVNMNGMTRHCVRNRAAGFPRPPKPPMLFNSSNEGLNSWKDGLNSPTISHTYPYSFYPFQANRGIPWLPEKPLAMDPLYNTNHSAFNLLQQKTVSPTVGPEDRHLNYYSPHKQDADLKSPTGNESSKNQNQQNLKDDTSTFSNVVSLPMPIKRSHELARLLQSPIEPVTAKRLKTDPAQDHISAEIERPANSNSNNNKNGRTLNPGTADLGGKQNDQALRTGPTVPYFMSRSGEGVENYATKSWFSSMNSLSPTNTNIISPTANDVSPRNSFDPTEPENNSSGSVDVAQSGAETHRHPCLSPDSPKSESQHSGLAKSPQVKGCVAIKSEYEIGSVKRTNNEETKSFQVKIEPPSFRHDHDVIAHKQIQNGTRDPREIDVCKVAHAFAAFSPENQLTNDDSGTKELTCRLCSLRFSSNADLQTHMTVAHKQDGFYKCDDCNYLGKNLSKLVEHIRIHTGERPFKCDQCSYAAKRKDNLAQHKAVRHDKRKTRPTDIYTMIEQIGSNGVRSSPNWGGDKPDSRNDRRNKLYTAPDVLSTPHPMLNEATSVASTPLTPPFYSYPPLHPLPPIFQYPFYASHAMLHPAHINPSLNPGVVTNGDGLSNPNNYSLKVRAALISP
ncbi:uncharacterized protein LOC104266396 [Ciona intestinalis]